MVGLSGEDELHARLSDEGFDDSEGRIFAFEHRALFDMKLKIGEGVVGQDLRRWKLRGIEAKGLNRLGDADAISIGACESLRIELPTKARLPRKGLLKRTPSSSEKPMTSMAKGSWLTLKLLDNREAENDTEDAVESSCIGHCVEMRTDDEAWSVRMCCRAKVREDCRWRRHGPSCRRLPSSSARARAPDAWKAQGRGA